jgi:hypothetical protein
MSNVITRLPPFIQKIVKKRSTTPAPYLSSAFLWKKTIEGFDIWSDVMDDNYQPFYEFHVKLNNDLIKENNDRSKFR